MDNLQTQMNESQQQEKVREPLGMIERIISNFFRRVHTGKLEVYFPSGNIVEFGNNDNLLKASLKINSLKFSILISVSGDLGFAESYIRGYLDTPDLTALLNLGSVNESPLSDVFQTNIISKFVNKYLHARNSNTRKGSSRNIAAHYDLGNDFYKLWLADTMTYSSAIFKNGQDSLKMAQRRKYMRLAKKLKLQSGERILEIGSGWGDFAEFAAQEFGCEVLTITLSEEQEAYVRYRINKMNLEDKVTVRFCDYRDVDGLFDKIVSIEMFEAVGEKFWPTYFNKLSKSLKHNGLIGLQVITISERYYEGYRNNPEFIQRYIFPGGMLPTSVALEEEASKSGMEIIDSFYFGSSYAETLRRWRTKFLANWLKIEQLGFDERFRRMWIYYMSYCEVGFENKQIDVGQFIIKPM